MSIISAQSIPCFEIWVLLHFENTTKPFQAAKDICGHLKKKRHIKGYDKEQTRDLYPYLKDKTDTAIKNAKHVLKEAINAETDNPSTHIHILVEDLLEQSRKPGVS